MKQSYLGCNVHKKKNSLSGVCETFDHTKNRIWKQHYNILLLLKSGWLDDTEFIEQYTR